ncbi:lysophospholipid acyltransferase family protein [Virgisporangium aliadipatigenens]|nr:lysophospholipid acyltransferase family protein [Virgisporangium aliadipatigenens]
MARGRMGFWQRFAAVIVRPVMIMWTRRTWRGAEHIPATGPVIIVANHLSHADPLVASHFIYSAAERWPQFLAKASLFSAPVIGPLLKRVRQIPVYRNSTDAAKALEAAVTAVKSGDLVIIYPEGTTTREPDLWPMRGRTGVARLALATGAPVVPMVMWGPQHIFDPRTHKFSVRPRRPVTVVAGPPMDLSRWTGVPPTAATLNELTDEIMLRLRDMLAEIRGEAAPPLWSPTRAESKKETR